MYVIGLWNKIRLCKRKKIRNFVFFFILEILNRFIVLTKCWGRKGINRLWIGSRPMMIVSKPSTVEVRIYCINFGRCEEAILDLFMILLNLYDQNLFEIVSWSNYFRSRSQSSAAANTSTRVPTTNFFTLGWVPVCWPVAARNGIQDEKFWRQPFTSRSWTTLLKSSTNRRWSWQKIWKKKSAMRASTSFLTSHIVRWT